MSSSDQKRRRRRKKKKGGMSTGAKIAIFAIELVVLAAAGIILYITTKTTETGKVEIAEEDIVINDSVKVAEETTMKGYWNIALFGVDSRQDQLTKNTRSDTIMIASINQDTGEIRLVSVYRDTYLNLGNDSYNKCNAAYAKGGPEQAINMLNMNMDMNITDFVTIGFQGLIDVVDALNGVNIDVQDAEIEHLNNYQRSMFLDEGGGGKLNDNIVPVTNSGMQTLSGLQATAYCRIRYTAGDDFRRAERQRTVLLACMDKAKTASVGQLTEIANKIFGEVYTSLDLNDIIALLGDIAKYNVVGQDGFPNESLRATGSIGSKGSCVVPVTLSNNVKWLHWFLFGDESYQPSQTVEQCSDKVYADTHTYIGN
ncbi:MAG: LCP family protein [Lachnospiraceae bacterium]|nr:LCP family protein [Lachnospiraceae bacterium]